MKHVHEKLRHLRKAKGMTQEKLAHVSKVSERTIQRAERGEDISIETLNDLAAALEVPVMSLIEADGAVAEPNIALRRVTSARAIIDDLAKAGVAHFDCTVDPGKEELQLVLELVGAIESRLPSPWNDSEQPEVLSLRQKIELAAKLTDLLTEATALGIGIFTANSWIRARYPYFDVDEGFRITRGVQPFENVMTMQILVARSDADRCYGQQIVSWNLEQEPEIARPAAFDSDLDDDDAPF